jgi:ferredoxin-NADP reductase
MTEYLLPLKHRQVVARDTMAFWFDTLGTGFTFKAGQNADFRLIDSPQTDGEGKARTFSFATSPNDRASLMVAMRMRNSAFKESLETIPLGTRLKVTSPMGSFTLHKDSSKPAVFLAGGIGITPIHSLIGWATEEQLPHRLYLFYSNRTPEETAFLNSLENWARVNLNFKLVATITASKDLSWPHEFGRIDEKMLTKHLPEIRNSAYYLAGPPAMVAAMRELLDHLGVSEDNLKTEEFAGY